jgi:hypothetical protein
VENRDNFGFDDEQEETKSSEETRGSEYSDIPSMSSAHTRVDTSKIEPAGTGCRTCFIFVLLIGAVLGYVYYHYQYQPQSQLAPTNAPPAQTQP